MAYKHISISAKKCDSLGGLRMYFRNISHTVWRSEVQDEGTSRFGVWEGPLPDSPTVRCHHVLIWGEEGGVSQGSVIRALMSLMRVPFPWTYHLKMPTFWSYHFGGEDFNIWIWGAVNIQRVALINPCRGLSGGDCPPTTLPAPGAIVPYFLEGMWSGVSLLPLWSYFRKVSWLERLKLEMRTAYDIGIKEENIKMTLKHLKS